MTVDELKIIITAEIAELKKNCEEAKKKVQDFNKEVEKQSKNVNKTFQKIGDRAKEVGEKIKKGLAVGAAAITALTVKALNAVSDLEQGTGGSEAVFKEWSKTIQDSAKNAASVCGLSASQYLAYANKMGALFQGTGMTVQQSAEMTKNYMQRAADVASIMGISVGDAMEAVTGAAKGNFTMMDNLGVAMNETTLANYALEKGYGKTYSAMTQAEKEMVAYNLFMEKSAYAAGNYSKENDTLAGAINTTKAAFNNFISGAGDFSSLIDAVSNAKDVIIENLHNMLEPYPELQSIVDTVISSIQKCLDIIVDVTKFTVYNWSVIEPILITVATLIGVITAAIGAYNIVHKLKIALDLEETASISAVNTALWAHLAAMAAAIAPYLAVAAAIAAVIAIIVICVKHWDNIKAKVSEVWESIKTKTSDAVQKVSNKFNELKEKITTPLEIARDKVKAVIDKIRSFFNFSWSLPKLKMPHVKISGEFSLVPPRVPKFSIDWYAKGGVIDTPTLFGYGNGRIGGMGEAGAEMIAPLENNTEWLDKIADRLNKNDTPTTFYFQVDGKTWAKATISNINALTKQTGHLGLITG